MSFVGLGMEYTGVYCMDISVILLILWCIYIIMTFFYMSVGLNNI